MTRSALTNCSLDSIYMSHCDAQVKATTSDNSYLGVVIEMYKD